MLLRSLPLCLALAVLAAPVAAAEAAKPAVDAAKPAADAAKPAADAAKPAAGPSSAAAAFQKAFSSEDADAKKAAVSALTNQSASPDDEAYTLLVQAIGDRQAHDAAIAALRARSGLSPSSHRGSGGYPGYPGGDTAAAWQAWLAARKADKDKDAKVKEALKAAQDAKKTAEGKGKGKDGEGDAAKGDGSTAAAPAAKPQPAPAATPSDLGKLDRVVFKTGGSLLCYILGKRTDPSGNLISVRVVHRDEGGEEILSADLIARIEEDIE